MLVLSRKLGEEIVIGEPGPDQIVIKLLRIGKKNTRLGIECRKEMPIQRDDQVDPGDRE